MEDVAVVFFFSFSDVLIIVYALIWSYRYAIELVLRFVHRTNLVFFIKIKCLIRVRKCPIHIKKVSTSYEVDTLQRFFQ